MLDLNLIRSDPGQVSRALQRRGVDVSFDELLELDTAARGLRVRADEARAERKAVSAKVGRRDAGDDSSVEEARRRSIELGAELDELDGRLMSLDQQIQQFLEVLPNVVDDAVPTGGKESNVELRRSGHPQRFDFEPLDHVELAGALGLIDYERGAKLAGSGFWVYTGVGAQLEWALLNYFVDSHLRDDYTFTLVPHLLREESGYAAGQFPKFAEDVFLLEPDADGGRGRFLLPTSETALVGLHTNETLDEAALPKKYFSYTPCYRREIGSYRSTDRGTLRGHQFNKVEMFQIVRPEDSDAAHDELVEKAERLVAGLGLHYRVSLLAAGDTSASMAKTCDIEVWLPSLDSYMEVSSVSNARDFQARRGKIRYKPKQGKSSFVHTLNGSGLATSRLLPAILEQQQQADGSVVVPEVLQQWVGTARLHPTAR